MLELDGSTARSLLYKGESKLNDHASESDLLRVRGFLHSATALVPLVHTCDTGKPPCQPKSSCSACSAQPAQHSVSGHVAPLLPCHCVTARGWGTASGVAELRHGDLREGCGTSKFFLEFFAIAIGNEISAT